jgi:hypothetical protein
MPTQLQTLYTGRSGQLAVMAQFLHRGYNVAIPEVDRGDDIFVVRDVDGALTRIQVKAANGRGTRRRYAQYKVPLVQLKKSRTPELYYIFAIYYEGEWQDYVVIPRQDLDDLRVQHGIGKVQGNNLFLRLSFSDSDVLCSGHDLQRYRDNWNHWPVIQH